MRSGFRWSTSLGGFGFTSTPTTTASEDGGETAEFGNAIVDFDWFGGSQFE